MIEGTKLGMHQPHHSISFNVAMTWKGVADQRAFERVAAVSGD
jgi:hypothetical protein